LGGIRTICFVSKEEYKNTLYFEKNNGTYGDFFIDYIIWPEELLTQEIFRIVTVAQALDVENFADGRARLLEYKVTPNLSIVGKKVKDCRFTNDTLIVGITRESQLFIPNGEPVLKEDDKLIFMGTSHSLDILAGTFFHEKEYVRSVAIIGGGEVGKMLAQNLEKVKIKTKIIESNYARCEELSQELEHTLIIHGDGTDLKLLDEEAINECDVAISVTNNDERNLLCSLISKQLGVKRVIARVSQVLNIPLFEKVGIDIAISPKNSAINEVRNDLAENDVDILATVEQGKGEVLEIAVKPEFSGKKIMDLKFPAPSIIGIIQRKNQVIIPKGDTNIRYDDILIIFTKSENAEDIKEFFKVK
jgi:trk system potassium uptake protein TrkA